MLRLIHNQTVVGPLLISDIDDRLPNKQTKRRGSTANPSATLRDGYATAAKQSCYVPHTSLIDATLPGYIDLEETERVILSAAKGKIAGLQNVGMISVVSLVATDLDQPAITSATLNAPAAGDLTLVGTNFLSVTPDITRVTLTGPGVGSVTLTAAQIAAVAPGAVTGTSIVIDSTLVPALAAGDTVTVTSDRKTSVAAVI